MKWKPIDTDDAKVRNRFNGYMEKRGKNECWPWTGPRANSGHGQIWDGERNVAAHRYALALTGANVDEAIVCHRCNNPSCVNPRHLYAGTYQTNIDDAMASGIKYGNPAPKGEDNYNAILTEQQVREARSLYVPRMPGRSGRALAKKYGVTQEAMAKCLRGDTWRHVDSFNNESKD